jgi:hypothetical protein
MKSRNVAEHAVPEQPRPVDYPRILELIRLIERNSSNEGAVLIYTRELRREIESAVSGDLPIHDYHVIWTINVDAETPFDGARKALAIQHVPTSIATIFHVRLATSGTNQADEQIIDVLAHEENSENRPA